LNSITAGSLDEIFLDGIPPRVKKSFTTKLLDSTDPNFKHSEEWWLQLWLIPKSEGSPSLVYEVGKSLRFADNARSWLVDSGSGIWYENERDAIDWGWEDLPNTVRRIAREDVVVYRTSEPSGERTRVLFELSRPNIEWQAKEIRRLGRWGHCSSILRPSRSNERFGSINSIPGAGPNFFEEFLQALRQISGARFTIQFLEDDPNNGKILLTPENRGSLPLALLICDGRPFDLLTGGYTDFSRARELGYKPNNTLAKRLPNFSPQERKILDYCLSWINDGVVECRRRPNESSNVVMNPVTRLDTKRGLQVEVGPNAWWDVVNVWEPWVKRANAVVLQDSER
jgi:hypothetical protein